MSARFCRTGPNCRGACVPRWLSWQGVAALVREFGHPEAWRRAAARLLRPRHAAATYRLPARLDPLEKAPRFGASEAESCRAPRLPRLRLPPHLRPSPRSAWASSSCVLLRPGGCPFRPRRVSSLGTAVCSWLRHARRLGHRSSCRPFCSSRASGSGRDGRRAPSQARHRGHELRGRYRLLQVPLEPSPDDLLTVLIRCVGAHRE